MKSGAYAHSRMKPRYHDEEEDRCTARRSRRLRATSSRNSGERSIASQSICVDGVSTSKYPPWPERPVRAACTPIRRACTQSYVSVGGHERRRGLRRASSNSASRSTMPATSKMRRTGPGGQTTTSSRSSRPSRARARRSRLTPLESRNSRSHRSRTNAPDARADRRRRAPPRPARPTAMSTSPREGDAGNVAEGRGVDLELLRVASGGTVGTPRGRPRLGRRCRRRPRADIADTGYAVPAWTPRASASSTPIPTWASCSTPASSSARGATRSRACCGSRPASGTPAPRSRPTAHHRGFLIIDGLLEPHGRGARPALLRAARPRRRDAARGSGTTRARTCARRSAGWCSSRPGSPCSTTGSCSGSCRGPSSASSSSTAARGARTTSRSRSPSRTTSASTTGCCSRSGTSRSAGAASRRTASSSRSRSATSGSPTSSARTGRRSRRRWAS